MKNTVLAVLGIFALGSMALRADNLTWGGTYAANWDSFGTSPYTATDTTNVQGLTLFCLDFNDEIAPPMAWAASIMPLTQANVAGTGAYAGKYAAQYGGAYNPLVTAIGGSSAPQISGPPYVFNGDTPSRGVGVTLTSQDPYTRYLEAAWLFTDIQKAVAVNANDLNTDMIAQVAAWELFVNSTNITQLTTDVKNYGGTFTFNNYLGLPVGDNYTNAPSLSRQPTGGLTFEQAVDAALAAAQNAVLNENWAGSSYEGSWSLVTGTPAFTVAFGQPVQEFLSPGAIPDAPPVPEPQAVFLLATVVGAVFWFRRRRLLA